MHMDRLRARRSIKCCGAVEQSHMAVYPFAEDGAASTVGEYAAW